MGKPSSLKINNFDGGLNLYKGAMSLGSNESPDELNVVPFPGRLKYRGGSAEYSPQEDPADMALDFYDQDGMKHFAVWNGGNLQDMVSGAPVDVETGVYTEGERIGACVINGILYWSTWSVPLRYWDPAAPAAGAVAQTGTDPPPSSPCLMVYTNAIVALGVDFGTKQTTVMAWSTVNDPGAWDAADAQAVGPLSATAELQFGLVLGIAEIGVTPFRTFVVARSDEGIYSYSGALGSLEEKLINCPTGCRDGASAQYLPGAENFGIIVFLGNDAQFWATNGITASPVSLQILPLLADQAGYAILANPNARFWSGYNEQFQYYFCNVSDVQFVYKWDMKCWTMFAGWPSGPVINSTDDQGVPALFVASDDQVSPRFMRIGLAGQPDNVTSVSTGTIPPIYWKSAWLHGGDPELTKIWQWVAIVANNVGTVYEVSARGLARANDGSYMETEPLYLSTTPGQSAGNPFILDVSILDGPSVLQPPGVLAPPSSPVMAHGRLACPFVAETDSMLVGITDLFEELKAVAVQFTIAYNGGTLDYDLLALLARFEEDGYQREGGNEYEAEAGVANPHSPFIPELVPVDEGEG